MKKRVSRPQRTVKKPEPAAALRAAKKVTLRTTDDELVRLRQGLAEAQEMLEAIRSGEVDAVVVSGKQGNKIYTLAGAEQPYRVYLERMQEGAVTVSREGLVLYCNQRFAEMLKVPLERVIGSSVISRLSPGTWEKLSGVFSSADDVVKHEDFLAQIGGHSLPILLTASRLPLEGQDVMCLVVTDFTGQKQQEELRLAKDLAEKANIAKDAFLAALSHELRTPLSPVLIAIAGLEQDLTLPLATRQQLSMVRRNVELEARLIDDLLDLTRISQGKLELRTRPMDLHAVLEDAVEICKSDLQAKGQSLRLEEQATTTQTSGDAVRLQQAMWNLIRNAVKFTPDGGTITVRTGNHEGTVWVEVKDTGIGFEPGTGARYFQAFEQGGRHITRQFGGLGLGLAICRSVIESHGGSIHAESPGIGKGATFTFEIPLHSGAANNLLPAAMRKSGIKRVPQPLKILLVEDHKDTRATMERWLRRAKHSVVAAESGQRAIEAAGAGPFDLVISDLGLPDITGFEVMTQLQDRFGLRGIAVSGYGMEEDVARSHAAGFLHHLTKPVSLEKLSALLAGWSRPAMPENS